MAKNESKRQKKLMRKRQKDKARKKKTLAQSMDLRFVTPSELNIAKEADYIILRAQQHESRVVSLGELVFFSTDTGDAWMLDKVDELALCLCRDGVRQPFRITDTAANFSIEWPCSYKIVDDGFWVIDHDARTRLIHGYPLDEIQQAIAGELATEEADDLDRETNSDDVPPWDRDFADSDAFDRKYREWAKRNWSSWLRERLTFPFMARREEDMDENPFAETSGNKPFSVGHKMEVLGFDEEDEDYGMLVQVREGSRKGVIPLADCEVTPKTDKNFWPVREYVVWMANH